jgi:hypothetical protein
MSRVAATDARVERLAALAARAAADASPLVVPGSLFEARLRTLALPEALLHLQADGASPLRRLVADAVAASPPPSASSSSAAVRRSWWLDRAVQTQGGLGLSATHAHLLFDLAVAWGGDLGSALESPSEAISGPFLPLADPDPTVVRRATCFRMRRVRPVPSIQKPYSIAGVGSLCVRTLLWALA